MKRSRVLIIALDAAEPSLIERWMGEGDLPNLAGIAAAGCYGRLASSARFLAGSPWPTFYTGTSPARHGRYHVLQWCAERMAHRRAGPEWLPERPFWRAEDWVARRIISVDVPTAAAIEPINGIEITGWSTHDQLGPPVSHPPELIDRVMRRFGEDPVRAEVYGPERAASILGQRDELIRAVGRGADLGRSLLEEEEPDLFIIAFGETHRGGHKLWDATGARGVVTHDQEEALRGALKELYVACDEAVGRLADAAEDMTLIVFSLHGMGPNTCRVPILPEMLRRVLSGDDGSRASSETVLKRLRRAVPVEWRNAVKERLPQSLQDWLSAFWRVGDIDFSKTRAFSAIADLQGYVRLNLKGREPAGVVDPEARDELCAEISEGLSSFVDADTGEPVADRVVRRDELYPDGERCGRLPDLLVLWSPIPACKHRAVSSPRYGVIPWPTPGRSPDGRSGNHRGEGFLLARGAGVPAGSTITGGDILDLLPTLADLLDLEPRAEWEGKTLVPVRP
jgi:predicted AlkP superfamily phosphohydrolase/phosphomutase